MSFDRYETDEIHYARRVWQDKLDARDTRTLAAQAEYVEWVREMTQLQLDKQDRIIELLEQLVGATLEMLDAK